MSMEPEKGGLNKDIGPPIRSPHIQWNINREYRMNRSETQENSNQWASWLTFHNFDNLFDLVVFDLDSFFAELFPSQYDLKRLFFF